MKRWSVYLTGILIVIAILALIGWFWDIENLKRPLPNTIAMNPMSAVGIIFLCLSLGSILNPLNQNLLSHSVFSLASYIVLLIGILQLSFLYLGSGFQVDHLLFPDKLEKSLRAGIESQLAPSTAGCFIIAATGLLTIRTRPLYAQWAALVISLISIFSIISYVYKVPEFYNTISFLPMSIQTAVCLLLFSFALLFVYPDKGLMFHFTSVFAGSKLSRVLIPAVIIIPATLGYIRLMLYWRQAFSTELGVAALILSITILFLAIIWLTTVQLNRKDRQRSEYENQLKHLNLELQQSNQETATLNEELTVANEELVTTNEQLNSLHSELENANSFRLLVESAPNAMVLINKEGKITLVNRQTEKLFGHSREFLLNKKIETLIPDRFVSHHPNYRSNFITHPQARNMGVGRDLFAKRSDGTEFPVEIGLNPIEVPEGLMVLAVIIDITERKKAEERFRLVVESAPNAMVLVNSDGRITLVNSQTEKLFGYSRKELMDMAVETLIPQRVRGHHPGFRKNFFAKPQTRSMGIGRDLFALRKNGSEFPVEIGLNPIESPEGTMVLASIIDITERKIQEANRLKSDFLANMSHELRTPLNAILGFSELLVDERVGKLSPKQQEYLNDIHSSGIHLLQLINDVLDIAKIESGKIELSTTRFSVSEIMETLIKTLKPIADKNQVKLILKLSPQINTVSLDKSKFRQIMFNLMSNALKFNRPGGTITLETEPAPNNHFVIHVHDTGIGMLAEDIKKIFVPFVQLDSGPSRKHEGTGLGLALTKSLAELHGGEISVKSAKGNGSTFSVLLPINTQPN